MSEYTCNEYGHCVCGEGLDVCRGDCCDATLRWLENPELWIGTPTNFRHAFYEDPWGDDDNLLSPDGRQQYACDDFGFGSDFGVWDGGSFEAIEGFTPARLWEMMITVGGVEERVSGEWMCEPKDIIGRVYAGAPDDAVIKAFVAKHDHRTPTPHG